MSGLQLLNAASVRFLATVLALLAAMPSGRVTRADTTAHFWLSTVDAGPVVPTIYAMPGTTVELHVWARPAANHRLAAFSLDVQSDTPGIVAFTSVDVLNPQLLETPSLDRHQLEFDSATGLVATPDVIEGFLGYSFFSGALGLENGAGMGPACGLDPMCGSLSGAPTWRVATIEIEADLAYGSTELRLAIGEHGLWQFDPTDNPVDVPDATNAVFGLSGDTLNQWDVDADEDPPDSDVDHRRNPVGLADATIVVADADFDDDGDVDGADLLTWQRGLGPGATHAEGDANGDGIANTVDLAVWRFQAGWSEAVLAAGMAVPEPGASMVALACATLGGAIRRRMVILKSTEGSGRQLPQARFYD
jgi:hypothetical protein